LIVDDVIATGGTALATAELSMSMGAKGVSIAALANLEALGGRQRLIAAGFPVFHIVDF
jgi:adenine phosphoribosyltransferase